MRVRTEDKPHIVTVRARRSGPDRGAGAVRTFAAWSAIVLPDQASSPGAVWGTLVLIGGALFIAVTEVEARRPASYGTTTIRPTA
ncbi:hypothetical protein [Nitriliruptor alkaliphilus]|uniref:hypothetical protein n=1 Tax=Nitriliruptor alkaliphilus TaxID=427918 RepID=UPI000695EDB2|nr:hypothetical protein [Nitriliruptor alkaliphilus]